jgi:hypothetical protein
MKWTLKQLQVLALCLMWMGLALWSSRWSTVLLRVFAIKPHRLGAARSDNCHSRAVIICTGTAQASY